MLWIFSYRVMGVAGRALSLRGQGKCGRGQVGLMLSSSLAEDMRLFLNKAGFIRAGRGLVLETGASLPNLGSPPRLASPVGRQIR